MPQSQSDILASMVSSKGANVPLLARVNLKLGTWQWALSSGLNDGSIQGEL